MPVIPDTPLPSPRFRASCPTPGAPLQPGERRQLEALTRRLLDEFAAECGSATVERIVGEVLATLLHGARFNAYVPLLTERFGRQRLRSLTDPRPAPLLRTPVARSTSTQPREVRP